MTLVGMELHGDKPQTQWAKMELDLSPVVDLRARKNSPVEKMGKPVRRQLTNEIQMSPYALKSHSMDQENVVSIHNGILCSHEEERNVIIHW
jgi:hypothetical protein